MSSGTIFAGAALTVVVYLAFCRRNSIRHIQGPPPPSWIFGHMLQLLLPDNYGDYEFNWQRLYGGLYRVKGCFGQDRLVVSDPQALQFVLNSPHFEHGPSLSNATELLFEQNCVMVVRGKGEAHKRLRAAMHVGFTASAVRGYQPLFENVAQAVTEQLEESPVSPVDICPILSKAMLNIVSQASLGYSTADLGPEFVVNNAQIMELASAQSAVQILANAIAVRLPKWVWLAVTHLPLAPFTVIRMAKSFAKKVGERSIREKIDAARQGSATKADVFDMLLDLSPSEKRRSTLTLEEVAAQTGLLLIAGQDTTSGTLTFGLLELAKSPQFQEELRAEIHSFFGRQPFTDSAMYENMPLLNAFIKETLRLYPAAALQERVATKDTVIPVMGNIKTSNGELINEIPISKGQVLFLAIASYQRLDTLWGEDADEFRPSRWLDETAYQAQALGPYGNLLSFLGGSRVCLGWRFAILEMQVFFCELVGKFSFAQESPVHARFANTLIPLLPNGQRGAPLQITRI
ncbi:cytochrome P450 [Mycena galopus ATCC 62051]|nr:cytochrome P450 [Mycena galopus ATCC 62051]